MSLRGGVLVRPPPRSSRNLPDRNPEPETLVPKKRLFYEIIRPKSGESIVWHVFTPLLVHRLDPKNAPCDLPCIAVRSSKTEYAFMYLVHHLECLGGSETLEEFDNPLPGTAGRGVVYCKTTHPVVVAYHRDELFTFDVSEGRDPKNILSEILRHYSNSKG